MLKHKIIKICLLFLCLVLTASIVSATALNQNTTNFNPDACCGLGPPNYTVGLPTYFTAPNLVDSMTSNFSGSFTGFIDSYVYRDPSTSWLTFAYEFTNNTDNIDLVRATIGDPSFPWQGWTIFDAGADESGSSSTNALAPSPWTDGDPNFLLRDPTISGEGLSIQWRASSIGTTLIDHDGSGTGHSSVIWFKTNAPWYQTTNVGLIDSGQVGNAFAYAPAVVPEPVSSTLFLVGAATLGFKRFRKKYKN